jgi:hypothetical protein
MPFDQSSAAEIELIVVTDDRTHARSLRDGLSRGRYRYSITDIAERGTLLADFEAAVEAVRGKRPVIVFLDCEFLRGQAEMLAARVLELRGAMAIECVATRPPREHHRRTHLRMLGASLFDECAQTAEIIPLH